MAEPDPDLELHGTAISPREWLLSGADPAVVLALAASFGDPA
ncbi:MAG: hypothetical protein ACYDH5_18795 [Acidimicrobiales bacterium]